MGQRSIHNTSCGEITVKVVSDKLKKLTRQIRTTGILKNKFVNKVFNIEIKNKQHSFLPFKHIKNEIPKFLLSTTSNAFFHSRSLNWCH